MTRLMQRSRGIGFYDEGSGEPVILLHSSGGSSRQWRKLKQHLAGRYRFLSH